MYGFALVFKEMLLKLCAVTCNCPFIPGVPSPASTLGASLSRSRCSHMKGAVLSPEVYLESSPVKPHLGPKLSSTQAGKRSSERFCHASESGFLQMWDVRIHPPTVVPPARREGKIDAKHLSVLQKVSVQDLAAGAFSAIIQPSLFIQSRATCRRKEFLVSAAKDSSSKSHIKILMCLRPVPFFSIILPSLCLFFIHCMALYSRFCRRRHRWWHRPMWCSRPEQ